MKRNILQVPIKDDLRKKAEKMADEKGYSSIQEMIRVVLTEMVREKAPLKTDIEEICEKYKVKHLAMFGSVARGEANDDSDIDLLVKFRENSGISLFDLAEMEEELGNKLGRKVDLITKINKHVEPYILRDLRTLYEEGQ